MYQISLSEELDVSIRRHTEKLLQAAAGKAKAKALLEQVSLQSQTCLQEDIPDTLI